MRVLAEASSGPSRVCCVILNWNGWRDTVRCLHSLREQQYSPLRVIVVDNCSSDDSVSRITEEYPEVLLIRAPANDGFAAGCNLGIKEALEQRADFIWLLNNDTLVPPDTLVYLLEASKPHDVGVVGAVLRYMQDPSQVQAWGGGEVLTWIGFVRHYISPHVLKRTSYLTFASALIRAEVFDHIGLLDEGYFMYFEDADFCLRAWRAGWRPVVAAQTAILHKEGGSVRQRKSPKMERIVTRSGLLFLGAHAENPALARTLFVVSKIGKRLLYGEVRGIKAVCLGVGDWLRGRRTAYREENERQP